MPRFLIPALLVLAAIGCAADTTITTDGYDTSCSVDSDCTLVLVGDVCGCTCDLSPISARELERYDAERKEKLAACEDVLNCEACAAVDAAAVCKQGTCVNAADLP